MAFSQSGFDNNRQIHQILLENYRDLDGFVDRRFPRRLRPYFDVSDIVQDVCIEAIRSFEKSPPLRPRSWLFGIATNVMLEFVQRHRSLKRGSGRVIGEDQLSRADRETIVLLQDLVVYHKTPSASVIRRELLLALEQALEAITESHRTVVNMRYIDGRAAADVASALGLSEDGVRQLAKRALAAIRDELRTYLPDDFWSNRSGRKRDYANAS